MSDVMRVQPFATELRRILTELETKDSIFDIPRALFYEPPPRARHEVPALFGKRLGTPVGPSAGPHTQLSQNIVSAWLCGGRFIELKTVQARDDLQIPRPCIDMTDEGYNVEWSQELRLDESLHEYVVAWALIHLLPRILGRDRTDATETQRGPAAIFDMSIGYDLEGIRSDRMTRFMDGLADASAYLRPIRETIARHFPRLADVEIPDQVVNSVTLSTMHGCPPQEIERIARYLLETRRLHTVIKLNPTLLGRPQVLEILHGSLGFGEIDIPDAVFDHDLQYERAIELIDALDQVAAAYGLTFGVKLSNTLAMRNHTGRLPGDEMYMSGRALYPVTMSLYARLAREFGGQLHVSYSGGADAENVPRILSCGALPVTGCTDLLKPGGYGRLRQWLEQLDASMATAEADTLAAWAHDGLRNVEAEARDALASPRYKKTAFPHGLPKVASGLGFWDCVVAPCIEACAVEQEVPDYAWLIAEGRYDEALQVILARNPLPGVTGYVCTHLCETRCTRNDYEASVAIRALKRVADERGQAGGAFCARAVGSGDGLRHVAIVGSGPSGLAAAAFLTLQGVKTTIFEARDVPGGMMRLVPPFRLPVEIIERDIARITALGVEIRLDSRVDGPPESLLGQGYDAVYVASGFQRDAPLRIPGTEGPDVVPALHLLDLSRRGQRLDLGRRAVVIGGGDTAMDAVRTAQRLTGQAVTILYRRTRSEMPAAAEEIEGALEEGNILQELVSPLEVLREAGRVTGVRCIHNRLGQSDADGRRSPQPITGSEFTVPCDSVIVAVGQLPELSFLDGSRVSRHAGGGIVVDQGSRCAGPAAIYAGGDVVIEPGSIISACADGRKAAEAICAQFGIAFAETPRPRPALSEGDILALKQTRARRLPARQPAMLPLAGRSDFALIESTLTEAEAREEALRCVQCATFCDKCVEVCPNRANYTFRIDPVTWQLPLLTWSGSRVVVSGHEPFVVQQDRQILHVDDFCNECDNCQTFCVHHGRPYTDKPRLFLDRVLFESERDNAFRVEGRRVRRRHQGVESCLTVEDGGLLYEDEDLRVRLDVSMRVREAAALHAFEGTRSLKPAAECYLLYMGIRRSLAFLVD